MDDTLQIIITVPKRKYELAKALYNCGITSNNWQSQCILDGQVLPEHFGRLIDADAAIDEIYWGNEDQAYFGDTDIDYEVIDFLKNRLTIVNKEMIK